MHLKGDVPSVREFKQSIDGFQILHAAEKRIHRVRETRRKNKLKVANGNTSLLL